MKRTPLIVGALVIGLASTAVIATAHDRGTGAREGRGGPAMLFERFDANADGAITMEEIQAAAESRFTEADTNGDGLLDAEEMAAAAEARASERRAGRRADRFEQRIARHDTDGDGVLSLEEATAIAGGERVQRMFEYLDADGDGTITQAEADAAKGMFGRGHRGKHGGAFDEN